MITKEKIKEFEHYHGYYDGFYLQKVTNKTNLTSDDEWYLMNELLQDFKLVKKGLTSKKYSDRLQQRFIDHFDNQESIEYFQKLANLEW